MNFEKTRKNFKIKSIFVIFIIALLCSSLCISACVFPKQKNEIVDEILLYDGFKYKKTTDDTCVIVGYEGIETNLIIPSQINDIVVTEIEKEAFINLQDLYSIYIPETIKSIGTSSLRGCTSLHSITVPYAVNLGRIFSKTIGSNYNANSVPQSLQELILLSSCTNIPTEAFTDCVSLRKIYIPASVEIIEDGSNRVIVGVNGHPSRSNVTLRPFYGCSPELEIYCELNEAPEGWKSFWNYIDYSTKLQTYWGKDNFD